jgi:hypothetical protein
MNSPEELNECQKELIEYQEIISKKANEDSSDTFPNAGKFHAALVMAEMFKKTQNSIRMLVGNLNGEVSNQEIYQEKLNELLKIKSVKFDIIFLDEPNKDSKALKLLNDAKAKGHQINFWKASKEIADSIIQKGKFLIHFSVFDDKMYRFEKDINNYAAWCNFNDQVIAGKLIKLFDQFKEQSTPLVAI